MSGSERSEFLGWYEGQKDSVFDSNQSWKRDDVSVLREACCLLRREFIHIGKIDVFLESITIASAFNNVNVFSNPTR